MRKENSRTLRLCDARGAIGGHLDVAGHRDVHGCVAKRSNSCFALTVAESIMSKYNQHDEKI